MSDGCYETVREAFGGEADGWVAEETLANTGYVRRLLRGPFRVLLREGERGMLAERERGMEIAQRIARNLE